MKKLSFLFACLTVLFLTSCNFTEEITFNDDGSGEFIMNYDMSQVMSALKEMGPPKEDEEGKEKKVLDSVIYFKDLLVEKADSIATLPKEKQEELRAMESVVMKMKMDEAEGLFNFGFGSTFKSLAELPEALEKIDKLKKMSNEGNGQADKMSESAIAKTSENVLEMVDFKYDGKTFSRFMKVDESQSSEDMEAMTTEIEGMGEMKDLFDEMSYTLVYNFPKPIKSVSNKNAKISDDKKTVTLKMNFMDMVKSPEAMNLNVVLED